MPWDDPNFDWSTTKFALFRSTWDYFHRFDEFTNWLNQASKQTQFLNSEDIIRWNLDKHYLIDLQKGGIHCTPTQFIEVNEQVTLAELYSEFDFDEPVVSSTVRHTYKLTKDNLLEHETILDN